MTLGRPPLICGARAEQDLTPEEEGRTAKPHMVKGPQGADVHAAAQSSAKDTFCHITVSLTRIPCPHRADALPEVRLRGTE